MVQTASANAEMLKAFIEAFNRHDLDEIMTFFSDNPVLDMPIGTQPWGQRAEGCADVRALLAARFAQIPDVHYAYDDHFVCGDRGASEWTLTGTTVEGRYLRVRGCDLYTFEQGKISRESAFWKVVE